MKKKSSNILFLGDIQYGTTSRQRYEAFFSLGHYVTAVQDFPKMIGFRQRLANWLYRRGLNYLGYYSEEVNREIMEKGRRGDFDLLWIEKGIYVTSETIEDIKRHNPQIKVLGYSPDYMAARHNNSRWFIEHSKHYDLFVTTKSYSVEWHKKVGCKRVFFQGNCFDPATHRPVKLNEAERKTLGGPIGFIGTYESARFQAMQFLSENGLSVKIYGSGWQKVEPVKGFSIMNRDVVGVEYGKAICSFDINLCFLRKMNFDLQTQRSVEIPACGAFMLAERTPEHLGLFREGKEAEFFGNPEELLDKCRYYLKHSSLRRKIALAGRRRCLKSGYSYSKRLNEALEKIWC